jgi:hypothetical protein
MLLWDTRYDGVAKANGRKKISAARSSEKRVAFSL